MKGHSEAGEACREANQKQEKLKGEKGWWVGEKEALLYEASASTLLAAAVLHRCCCVADEE